MFLLKMFLNIYKITQEMKVMLDMFFKHPSLSVLLTVNIKCLNNIVDQLI